MPAPDAPLRLELDGALARRAGPPLEPAPPILFTPVPWKTGYT